MQVGLDTFSIRELKLSGMETLSWLKEHEFAGALFGGLGSFSPGLDLAELKEARGHADALGLYTEVSVPGCNPHQVKGPLEEHRQAVARQIELAAECGWHELHTALGGGEERYLDTVAWADQLRDAALFIRSLAPVLRAHGSRINLETHGDVTTFELIRLIEDVGPDIAGICLDTANLLCHCEDPCRAAHRAAPYVHMTHIKDAMITLIGSGYRRQSLPPGRGVLDWKSILPALAEYEPNLRLSIEDHKWLFDFHVFDPHWLRLHPDLTVEEFGAVMQMAWSCQQKVASGELPDPETYNAIPFLEELEERLGSGRDYLKVMLDKLDLGDQPDVQRAGMHRPMVPPEWPLR
jgi:sugar phosphate isomerase/epimerase